MKITFKDKVFDLAPAKVEKKMARVSPEPGSKYFIEINKQEYPIKQIITKNSGWYFIKYFPLFLAISMGLSLHNSNAVVGGLLGKKSIRQLHTYL